MKIKLNLLILWVSLAGLLAPDVALAFYNPSAGRWLNRDPIEERGGQNLYAVVRNNPIDKVDPFGLAETVSGIPDVLLNPDPTPFNCPTPLQNLQPFEISIRICGRQCTRQRILITGQLGDCYSQMGQFLGQVMTGPQSSTSMYFSLFCCCRTGKGNITFKFGTAELDRDFTVDVQAYLNSLPFTSN